MENDLVHIRRLYLPFLRMKKGVILDFKSEYFDFKSSLIDSYEQRLFNSARKYFLSPFLRDASLQKKINPLKKI